MKISKQLPKIPKLKVEVKGMVEVNEGGNKIIMIESFRVLE